jgi:ABC-type polysaccharide/polyol phosphate export permease
MAFDQGAPTYDSDAPGRQILDEMRALVHYRDLVRNLIRRNVTARYKRSILGVLWTLLDPLLTMLVMSIIYTALFARSIPDFPVFLLAGIIIWSFFSQASTRAMGDLVFGGGLIGRVYMPKSIFGVAATGTGLVNFLLALGPLLIFMVVFQRPFTSALLFIPIALLIITVFTLGVGLFMSAFAVFFVDMLNVYSILLRLLMYFSGIFYPLAVLPEKLQKLVTLIPTYHMIKIFRDPIYNGSLPPIESIAYISIWAIGMFVIGFWIFTRLSDEYAYRV